ncbi:MAG: hypothetical protein H6815_07315 [Phycisphaeraceae bacterium]|nr:hypothetical protein [Phycisphaerales bacterium]MCB9860250.1 hypothetical protein [Phycisphaeraceae bacterium]
MDPWLILVWGLVAIGTVLLAWSLFSDRAKGRKRCRKCWYAFDEINANGDGVTTCPECGKEHTKPKSMLRTRRRWRWACAGLLMVMLSYASHIVHIGMTQGWLRAIPSSVLVFIAPMDEKQWDSTDVIWEGPRMYSPVSPLANEILNRLDAGTLTHWQTRAFMRRLIDTEPALINSCIVMREKWPVDMPLRVETRFGDYLPSIDGKMVASRARVKGTSAWHASQDEISIAELRFQHEKNPFGTHQPPLATDWQDRLYPIIAPSGSAPFTVEVEAQLVLVDIDSDWNLEALLDKSPVVWQGTIGTITVSGAIDDCITFFESEEVDRNLADHVRCVRSGSYICIEYGPLYRQMPGSEHESWGLGLQAELMHNGTVLGRAQFIIDNPNKDTGMNIFSPPTHRYLLTETCDVQHTGELSVRITADPEMCLIDGHTICWNGTVTIPVQEK